MTDTKIIKLKEDTIQMLQGLKVVERESYDDVVKRLLLQCLTEEQLDLNDKTKYILLKRIKEMHEGKVKSSNQILESIKKREEMMAKREGKDITKLDPGRLSKHAKLYY